MADPIEADSRIAALIYDCLLADPAARMERLEELCVAHPDDADALRARYERLAGMGILTDENGELPSWDGTEALPERLGEYRIDGIIGRGGMGIVYRGAQTNLGDRPVAIKALLPERVGDARSAERFAREGLLAARLDHPNVCPVLDVGRDDGVLYLVMPLIEGRSLRAVLDEREGTGDAAIDLPGSDDLAPWRRVVELGRTLGLALDHAHRRGLVHRDVKPDNVVLRSDGRPVLLDFGLARTLGDEEVALTRSLDLVGSPAYMAPEQADPRGRKADERTDVHGLAATLYECLTGELPRAATTRDRLLERIARDPATPLRRHAHHLPRDLEAVLAVALESSPDRRYASAEAFAEDLGRVLSGRPVDAVQPGPIERGRRWVVRNPVAAALIATLAIGLGTSAALTSRVQSESRGRAAALERANAEIEWSSHKRLEAFEAALEARRLDPDAPATAGLLMRSLGGMRETVRFEGFNTLDAFHVHPAGRFLASRTEAGAEVRSVDDPGAPPVHLLDVQPHTIRWTRDDSMVVHRGGGEVERFDPSGSSIWTASVEIGAPAEGMRATPAFMVGRGDEEVLLLGTHVGTILTLSAATGDVVGEVGVGAEGGTVHQIATFDPPDRVLVAVLERRGRASVHRLDFETEKTRTLEEGLRSRVTRLGGDPDGWYVAYAAPTRDLRVGSLDPERPVPSGLQQFQNTDFRVRACDLGRTHVAVTVNDQAWVFDLAHPTEDPEGVLLPHRGAVSGVRLLGDGRSAVTSTSDGRLSLRGLRTGVHTRTLMQSPGSQITNFAVCSGGRIIVRVTDGTVHVLEPPRAPFLRKQIRHGWAQLSPSWLDDDTLVVAMSALGLARVFDPAKGEELDPFVAPTVQVGGTARNFELVSANGSAHGACFASLLERDRRHLVIMRGLDRDGVTSVPLERGLPTWRPHGMSSTRDGDALAVLQIHHRIGPDVTAVTLLRRDESGDDSAWKIVRGAEQSERRVQQVYMLDHDRVLCACFDGSVVVTDLLTEEVLLERPGVGASSVACTPDGGTVLAGYGDGRLAFLGLPTAEARIVDGHDAAIVSIAVTLDGSLAATADATGEMCLWDVSRAEITCRWKGHDARIRRMEFSPEGTRLASTSVFGTLATWPADVVDVDRIAERSRPVVVQVGR
ncbi:MAG: WD40 repeat domain-containing serine/threonine protein kinase [Planctomycetota bacterium]